MHNTILLQESSAEENEAVPRIFLSENVNSGELERIINHTNPSGSSTELAIIGLMQNELRQFESSLDRELGKIVSEVYYSEVPRPIMEVGIAGFKKEAKQFLKEYGHNLAFLAALNVDLTSPEAANHFYNGSTRGNEIGKKISDVPLESLIKMGQEDGAILTGSKGEILKKNILFFNICPEYSPPSGLSGAKLRESYGFKDPSVNCRHFAGLMMSRYVHGPVVTLSETGVFRAYKHGEIIRSTYPGEINGNYESALLDSMQNQFGEACSLYEKNMEAKINSMVRGLKRYISFDKGEEAALKKRMYGLRAQDGHRTAYIAAVVRGPAKGYEGHIFNGSSPREGTGMDVKEKTFEEHFRKIGREDGACIFNGEGRLLMANTHFVGLDTGCLPGGIKKGARTLNSMAFTGVTGFPVIILKESGEIMRFGNYGGMVHGYTLSGGFNYGPGNAL